MTKFQSSYPPEKKKELNLISNYLLLDADYFRQREGVKNNCRIKLIEFLTTKTYLLIVRMYNFLYFGVFALYFILQERIQDLNPDELKVLVLIEMIILCLFLFDIALHLFAYHWLYFKDPWNRLDLLVVIVNIACMEWSIIVFGGSNESVIDSSLRIQGVLRLSRLYILIRQFNLIRKKQDALVYLST